MDDNKKLSTSHRSEVQAPAISGTGPAAQQVSTQYNGTYQILVALASPRENEFTRISQNELFYEQVLAHAGQYAEVELINELRNLENLDGDPRKMAKVASIYKRLFRQLQLKLTENHTALGLTEMYMGIAQYKARDAESSVKTLRSAVTRFQQCDDEVDVKTFVESLCSLATSYRETGAYEASRTCIKQAYRLMENVEVSLHLQCATLEELAADLVCEHRYKSALEAYEKVVLMKSELIHSESTDIVRPLIQLSMCYFALHQLDSAEHCLIKAGEIYHKLKYKDRDLLVQILDALAGTVRNKGQFFQADLLEESALEIRGRSEQSGGHMIYGNLLKDALKAESEGNPAAAKNKYREALMLLEGQRLKRAAERLQILSKLLLLTNSNQLVQRSSLCSDIEDSVRAIFCGMPISTFDGIKRMGLIYELCGKKPQANNLKLLIAELNNRNMQIEADAQNENNKVTMQQGSALSGTKHIGQVIEVVAENIEVQRIATISSEIIAIEDVDDAEEV